MNLTLDKSAFPEWTRYVVIAWGATHAAPCSTLERAITCMVENGIALRCEVIRFEDDVMVWPLHTKGGSA